MIASPDTIGGVAYISCFIQLSNPSDLSAVRALGVRVQETFDGLDFITASVPVHQVNGNWHRSNAQFDVQNATPTYAQAIATYPVGMERILNGSSTTSYTDGGSNNGGTNSNGSGGSGNGGNSGGSGSITTGVAAPSINGNAAFTTSTQVTMSGPDGAEIRYTSDGSTPTASSTLYTEAITVSSSVTLKAIAIKDGQSSEVTTKQFVKSDGGADDPSGFEGA